MYSSNTPCLVLDLLNSGEETKQGKEEPLTGVMVEIIPEGGFLFREAKKMANIKVNNVPAYARNCPYWVCRTDNNELWFWGAWTQENEAQQVAREIGGLVVENEL